MPKIEINEDTILDLMQKAIDTYEKKGMMMDVLFWGEMKYVVGEILQGKKGK